MGSRKDRFLSSADAVANRLFSQLVRHSDGVAYWRPGDPFDDEAKKIWQNLVIYQDERDAYLRRTRRKRRARK